MLKKLLILTTLTTLSFANEQRVQTDGSVYVNARAITPSTIIKSGDIITTKKNSKIKFNIGKDAFMSKGASKFRVRKTKDSRVLEVINGGVVAVFGGGGKHEIRTQNMTAGIRGTGTYTLVKDGKTYFCTCYGETDINSTTTNEKLNLKTHHHKMVWIKKDAIKPAMQMEGHDDADLIEIEAFVGRKADFS